MKTEATENECDVSITQHMNPTENFFKFSPCFTFPRHSQTLVMEAMTVLFIELPEMQLHYDPMFDSLYIVGSCRFRLYLFSHQDFGIPLFHPTFDPLVPYFAMPLYVAHPTPPPPPTAPTTPTAPVATPPTSPPPVVPDIPLSLESDPSEASDSPSSSFGPDADYTPVGPSIQQLPVRVDLDQQTMMSSITLF